MPTDRVGATRTSIEILEVIAEKGDAGVTEVANAVDGSKANVYKHLKTLEDARFVQERGGTYRLAHRFLEFGSTAKRREPVYREGVTNVTKLSEITGSVTTLAVPEDGEIVYLHRSSPVGMERTGPSAGQRRPLHETAGGLAVLSAYPESQRRTVVEESVASDAAVESALAELRTVEQRGTAVAHGDETDQPREIAAPITTDDGRPVGAVGLWQPTDGDEGDRIETDLKNLVRNTAGTVSKRLALTR